MSEYWRKKEYYRPRVLVEVSSLTETSGDECILCLEPAELNLLRNLLRYAHYRSTWVDEYHDTYYLAPDNTQWDDIESFVATLEGKLMACDDWMQKIDQLLEQTAARGGLDYDPTDPEQQAAFTLDSTLPDESMSPTDELACAIAQLWYAWGYEVVTEHILPATRFTFDWLMSAIAGFVGLATGGPPAALGAYLLAELVQELVQGAYDASETNLVNWLDSVRDDIICALYDALRAGGTATDIWSTVYAAEVQPSEDISSGDKAIVWLAMGAWAGVNARIAHTANTQWAQDNVTAGYCTICADPLNPVFYGTPCPGTWGSESGHCTNGYIDTGPNEQNAYAAHQFTLPVGSYSLDYRFVLRSPQNINWTVGWVRLQQYNSVTESWENLHSNQALLSGGNNVIVERTLGPVGVENDYTQVRVHVYYQPNNSLEIHEIELEFTPAE